jgi:outer membrane protein TolC
MRRALVLALAAALPACQTFSPDGGMSVVADIAGPALRTDVVALNTPEEDAAARAKVKALLRRPLSADAAVRIALLNNRGLQAAYNELGLAEAVMVQASLPPNPTISVERLSGPVEIEVEKRIVANILALATLPARASIAADRFHQAQLRAAEDTLRIAADTRRAYYRAVAGRETVAILAQAQSAAETAGRLAARLGETGALNKLDQAREHVFYAEITAQLAGARQHASSERERLVRLMGLWGNDIALRLPAALPRLPGRPRALPTVEIEAVARRVDLQIARIELIALAKSHGLTEATRFINLLEVAGIAKTTRERETGERIRDRGFEIEFQIPLFDFGEVRVRQAELTYRQAVNRLIEKAVNVRSEARDAYRTYRSTYDIAAHYRREILPLRQIISDEMLLRYNAMQIDVFALLVEARQRLNARVAAIDANRAFWLAATDLNAAVVGGGTAPGGESPRTPMAAAGAGSDGH